MEDTEQALWPLLHVSLGMLEVVLLFVREVAAGQLFYQPVKVKIEKIMSKYSVHLMQKQPVMNLQQWIMLHSPTQWTLGLLVPLPSTSVLPTTSSQRTVRCL